VGPEASFFLGLFIGIGVTAVVGFLVIKNNRKKFEKLLEADLEATAKDILKDIRSKF